MSKRLAAFTTLMAIAVVSQADDGILYDSGAPCLMHGESNIRMVREYVRAKVYESYSKVYCRFVFHNDGPAIQARVGFPDGPDIGYEGDEKPYFVLKNFRSKVDGKDVVTQMQIPTQGDKNTAPTYHVKTVHFAKGQTRIIEDWYRCDHSGGATNSHTKNGKENLYISQFHYIMASGGSWKGNIGEAVMDIVFTNLHPRLLAESEFGDPIESKTLGTLKKNRVIWKGFAKPTAHANTVTFRRKNFKPTQKDDVLLTFSWLPYDQSPVGKYGSSGSK